MEKVLKNIAVEFSYPYMFLYDSCRKIRKGLNSVLPEVKENDDPRKQIVLFSEDGDNVLRVTPNETGFCWFLKETLSKQLLENFVSAYYKIFNTVTTAIEVENLISDIGIIVEYEITFEENEIDLFKKKAFMSERFSSLLADDGLSDFKVTYIKNDEQSTSVYNFNQENDSIITFNFTRNYSPSYTDGKIIELINQVNDEAQRVLEKLNL